jgi:hypothetical protein
MDHLLGPNWLSTARRRRLFITWARHQEEANFMDAVPGDNPCPPKPFDQFTRDELLEYWRICDGVINGGGVTMRTPSARPTRLA